MTWLVLVIAVPILVSYWLVSLAQREGAAPGGTNYRATATVVSCSRPALTLGLVVHCRADVHLSDTAGGAGVPQIHTHTLVAADPVSGTVPVVERCLTGGHGFAGDCYLYDTRLIRSVWWWWVSFLPLPIAVLAWLTLRMRRLRRRGLLGPARGRDTADTQNPVSPFQGGNPR